MKTETAAKLVTIYVNSSDHHHGRPMYAAIVELCQRQGVAGVTVTRALEGYGSHHQLHTLRLLDLSENLPLRIEIVDVAEKIEPLITALTGLIAEGLITVTDVRAIRMSPDSKTPTS